MGPDGAQGRKSGAARRRFAPSALASLAEIVGRRLLAPLLLAAAEGFPAGDRLFDHLAPLSRPHVERYKVQAIALPVSLILALPMLWFASIDPGAAALTFLFAAGAGIASACLNLWHPSLGKRRDLMRRHHQSRFVGMMEHLMSLLFAVGCAFALIGSLLALLAVALALAVLGLSDSHRVNDGRRVFVLVVIATTLVTPPSLKWALGARGRSRGAGEPEHAPTRG